jgi:hypothetical protein
MMETSEVQETTQAPPAQAADAAQTFPADYVQQLRQEAAAARVKLREIEESQKKADEARLVEQQEWQKLAETRAQEVEQLRPFQEKYAAMLEAIKSGNEKRLEQVPDTMRSLIPPIEDPATLGQWLDANWHILTGKPTIPALNGAAGSNQPRTIPAGGTLSEAELTMAANMGISPEDYLASKQPKTR